MIKKHQGTKTPSRAFLFSESIGGRSLTKETIKKEFFVSSCLGVSFTLPFAQAKEFGRSWSEYLSRRTEWPMWAGIAFLIVVAAVAVKTLWPHLRRSRDVQGRFDLFASAHGLSRAEVRLLRRMGRVRFPDEPALIFVSPSTFDSAAPSVGLDPARAAGLRQRLYS